MTESVVASHYSGCGNDFLLFDDREEKLPPFSPKTIQTFCEPEGVDGLIIVRPSIKADVAMKFYNCDGTEAEMCGNGVRCLMQYLRERRSYPNPQCLLETQKRTIFIECEGKDIVVHIGQIEEIKWDIPLEGFTLHHLNSGVPHVVIFVDDVEQVDVEALGSFIRRHPLFAPQGTNVNFVSHGKIRTFERGVEGETLACGTGVLASCYSLAKLQKLASPITLQVRSGDSLSVLFDNKDGKIDNIRLKGPATWIKDVRFML